MADYILWGKIQHIGVDEFAVIVSAIEQAPGTGAVVKSTVTSTREKAILERDMLLAQLGGDLRTAGHRIVDVEED